VYARPELNGTPSTLGVSGMLWRDSLVMYDRATRSLWSQVNGKAVAGPMEGKRLEELPSEQTTWGEWKRRYPDTLVLVKPQLSGSPYERYFENPNLIGVRGSRNPDSRLAGKELVLGLEADGRHAAVPLDALRRRPILLTNALDRPIVITRTAAYDRRVGERTLTFEPADAGRMRDHETGSSWSVETGEAIVGPLQGQRLTRISAKTVYWAIWVKFHPESEIVKP
jgi:hypothetical protein